MELKEIVKSLPGVIAATIEDIYLVNKNTNESYYIKYEGSKIIVEEPQDYNIFVEYINKIDPTLLNEIETKETVKKFVNNYMFDIVSQGDFKLVLVNDCNIEEEKKEYAVIIADDSTIITNFFTKIFKERFNVIVASNGEEAIKLFEENKANIIGCFVDLQMPVKNGYEVLDYFKENNLFAQYPVSVISGEDGTSTITELMSKYGIVDMLQKPFNNESVTNIVNKTISLSPNYKG